LKRDVEGEVVLKVVNGCFVLGWRGGDLDFCGERQELFLTDSMVKNLEDLLHDYKCHPLAPKHYGRQTARIVDDYIISTERARGEIDEASDEF
jgi:hypothetical protein